MNRPREQESTDEKQAFCRRHRASMPRTHRRIKGGVALDGPLHRRARRPSVDGRRGRPPRRPEFRSAFVGHLEWGQLATRRCRRRGCADATLGLGRGRGPVPAVTVEAAVADVVALRQLRSGSQAASRSISSSARRPGRTRISTIACSPPISPAGTSSSLTQARCRPGRTLMIAMRSGVGPRPRRRGASSSSRRRRRRSLELPARGPRLDHRVRYSVRAS